MFLDYFDYFFGCDYVFLINEWYLLVCVVFVFDIDNIICYVEYVDNINFELNFEVIIAAVKVL